MTTGAPHRESGQHAVDAEMLASTSPPAVLDLLEADRDEPTRGPTFWRRAARVALGSVLLIIGLLELFLPGPGLVFIAIGLTLLAPEIPLVRRAVVSVYRRWPRVRRLVPRRYRRTRRHDADS